DTAFGHCRCFQAQLRLEPGPYLSEAAHSSTATSLMVTLGRGFERVGARRARTVHLREETMKVVARGKTRQASIRGSVSAAPAAGEALARVRRAEICGTDLRT
ncbi:MAG: hypothetical protein ACRD3O_07330, partial [Terriglobia bacterium]